MAVGALGLLLLGCLAAVGLYVAKPSLFGVSSPPVEPVKQVTIQPLEDSNSADPASGTTTAGAEPAGGIDPGTSTEVPKTVEAPKQTETTKNNKSAGNQRSQTGDSEPEIQMPDGDTGDITVTERGSDGTVTTTHIKPAPIPPSMRGQTPNGADPFPRSFDPSKFPGMTPAQRRQLQQAIREAQRQQQVSRPPKN